ncbi:uncharacterized protein J7T54_003408 [Emericellopsis cladophorae]|uniref:Infection structure specific protein n=1 Tax=Emericellopsis cladophorae TaxID=2686198 RepID=A0A9P9Y1U4_9HYPO|nr:uncharacterized protein J7T54_003408 [Emericellopsis cladophorae]KAI6781989.1 hypothetical protein J7T54_003408 [Emericellopsis cladophorae]
MRAAQQTTVALLAVGAVALDQRDIDECTDYVQEIYPILTATPTLEPSLYSFLAEQTQLATITELCEIPHVTGSLAGEYTAYVSSLTSWIAENSAIFESFIEACTDVPEVQDLLNGMPVPTMCSNISWADGASDDKTTATVTTPATTTATATVTPTPSSDNDGEDSGNDGGDENEGGDGGNAAGRQTVSIGAALAVVGALVVAL